LLELLGLAHERPKVGEATTDVALNIGQEIRHGPNANACAVSLPAPRTTRVLLSIRVPGVARLAAAALLVSGPAKPDSERSLDELPCQITSVLCGHHARPAGWPVTRDGEKNVGPRGGPQVRHQ
jgi:hypothetical protein